MPNAVPVTQKTNNQKVMLYLPTRHYGWSLKKVVHHEMQWNNEAIYTEQSTIMVRILFSL
jgi:hypothetical protein